jgi:hypothetical protein
VSGERAGVRANADHTAQDRNLDAWNRDCRGQPRGTARHRTRDGTVPGCASLGIPRIDRRR